MNSHLLPSDEAWRSDSGLIAELSSTNMQVAKYIMRYLDADAGRQEPTSVEDERALGVRLVELGETLQARADRRAVLGDQPMTIEGEAEGSRHSTDGGM